MNEIYYPTVEQIIEFNHLALLVIKVKKADKPQVLNKPRLYEIIEECKECEGDIYDKAVILLAGIIKKHPFASGNRRTAFLVMKDFLLHNNGKLYISDDPEQARVLLGIREGFYRLEEIKEWIKHGKIRSFQR